MNSSILALLLALSLTISNGLVSIVLLNKALKKKKHQSFSDYVFKSIGIRSVIVLLLFGLIVSFTDIDIIVFSITFIISYFFILLLEIVYFNNYFKRKQGN